MKDVSQLSEDEIIALFNVAAPKPPLLKGIGDDCAVLGPFGDDVLVWTADLLTEDVHFTRESSSPADLGYKSMAVNLSDIAAMGAKPVAAVLSIALPPSTSEEWLRGFRDGFIEATKQFDCPTAGGDTTTAREVIMISVTILGRTRREHLLMRDGASPGEDIWISGVPGLSATGFELLSRDMPPSDDAQRTAIERHIRPLPRIELGYMLGTQQLASAAIDSSDGISQDLHRLCKASGVGAEIEEALIPLSPEIDEINVAPLEMALHGGEDYQLLFTASPKKREQIATLDDVTRIGTTTAGEAIVRIKRIDGTVEMVKRGGFQHFRGEDQD